MPQFDSRMIKPQFYAIRAKSAKAMWEQPNSVNKVSNFGIATLFLFPSMKKRGNFKIGNIFDWIESFLYCVNSEAYENLMPRYLGMGIFKFLTK